MKTSEMLATSRQPDRAAVDIAHRMRALMAEDLDEYVLAQKVEAMNAELAMNDLFEAAWTVLASNERSAWKGFLNLRKAHGHRY